MKKTLTLLTILLAFCMPVFADENDNVISLNGHDWELTFWEQPDKPIRTPKDMKGIDAQTIVASVPGNVELDLMNAGLYPKDIMKGNRAYEIFNWERYQWCYTKKFDMSELQEGQRAILYMGGVDCLADVWLNGEKVASLENMLIEHEMDITDLLKKKNTLQVIFRSVMAEAQNYRVGTLPYRMDASPATMNFLNIRKSTHAYGWSILPRILSAALYRDVEIRVKNPVNIVDVNWYTVWIDKANKTADLYADFQLKAPLAKFDDLTTVFTLFKDGKETVRQSAPLLSYAGRHHVRVPNAELWWPRGYGEPALYDATVRILDGDGNIVDCDTKKIGIRTVKLDFTPVHTEDNPGRFCFIVNGERIFARGSNWTPMDALHSRDPQHLEKTVALAVDLNCNMLRCWGGNVYEDDRFYELCDENGIMVWQDFAMGCTFYSQTERFTDAIEEEVSAVVMRLRSHPSIALWSGNNENDQTLTIGTLAPLRMDPNRDAVSRQVIPSVLYELDPTRTYLPSSPYWSEELCRSYYSTSALPEDHLWGPRGYYKDPFYTEANCLFVSEIGYHGMPCRESLEKMFPEESVYPWTDTGNFRWNEDYLTKSVRIFKEWGYTPDRNNLMINQVRLLFGEVPSDLDRFIFASQSVQAEAMKYFIEIYRGNKFAPKTGILWWNVRDGWPVISDAVTDYYFNKKLAYWFIRNVQKNVCLMVNDPVDGCYPLVAVNDTRVPASGKVSVKDIGSGEKIFEGEYTVGANSRGLVARLPQREGQGMLLITYTGPDGECRNHYLYGNAPFDLDWYGKMLRKTGIYEIK